jgi:hypothetical protein
MECKYTFKKMFLTDVLLFTHLVHLPIGHMRQKPLMLLRRSIVIGSENI